MKQADRGLQSPSGKAGWRRRKEPSDSGRAQRWMGKAARRSRTSGGVQRGRFPRASPARLVRESESPRPGQEGSRQAPGDLLGVVHNKCGRSPTRPVMVATSRAVCRTSGRAESCGPQHIPGVAPERRSRRFPPACSPAWLAKGMVKEQGGKIKHGSRIYHRIMKDRIIRREAGRRERRAPSRPPFVFLSS